MNNPFVRKNVLVVGAGLSGVNVANLLLRHGAFVKLTTLSFDEKVWGGDIYSMLDRKIDIEIGRHSEAFAKGSHLVVISPGVKRNNPVVEWALKNQVPLISELECAYHFARAPIIGITGTNGKSTTIELTAQILRNNKFDIKLGGNLDIPFSGLVMEEGEVDYYVLELSSFQLEWISEFTPCIGAILNISPNHLDHHTSYQEYVEAKFKIFNRQTTKDYVVIPDAILNGFAEYVDRAKGTKVIINTLWPEKDTVFIKDGWLCGNYPGTQTPQQILPLGEIKIPGAHNVRNVMVAASIAILAAVRPAVIRETVKNFYGLTHRIETVASIGGVRYVDDSKSTTPASTLVAIDSFEGPAVLLMGGIPKSADFDTMRTVVGKRVKLLITFGRAAAMIFKTFNDITRVIEVGSMKEAVEVSHRHAVMGDTVLLSPACASFDMFSSYKERGKVFKKFVRQLSDRNLRRDTNSGLPEQLVGSKS